jgi:hypothetical protein
VEPDAAPDANLEELLRSKPAERAKWLLDQSDQKLTGKSADALKKASIIDDLLAALEKKIARNVTPNASDGSPPATPWRQT